MFGIDFVLFSKLQRNVMRKHAPGNTVYSNIGGGAQSL
jgi:hypothetical protein